MIGQRNYVQYNKKRAMIDAAKNRPCVDCGQKYPGVCMDLDHRDGTEKRTGRGSFIRYAMNVGVATLQKELDKCDVRCANCHRIRHAEVDRAAA